MTLYATKNVLLRDTVHNLMARQLVTGHSFHVQLSQSVHTQKKYLQPDLFRQKHHVRRGTYPDIHPRSPNAMYHSKKIDHGKMIKLAPCPFFYPAARGLKLSHKVSAGFPRSSKYYTWVLRTDVGRLLAPRESQVQLFYSLSCWHAIWGWTLSRNEWTV